MYEQVLFDRRTTRRIRARRATASTKPGSGERLSFAVRDLSLHGVQVGGGRALPVGQSVILEVRHPVVPAPPPLPSRVIWSGLGSDNEPRMGLEFTLVSPQQRNALRRLLAAEAGQVVLDGERLVGFLLSVAEGVWTLFDERATKTALVNREGPGRYQVCLPGSDLRASHRYEQVTSLDAGLSLVYDLAQAPRLDPPLERAQETPPPPPPPAPTPAPPAPAAPRPPAEAPRAPAPPAARAGLAREQPALPREERRPSSSDAMTPLAADGSPQPIPEPALRESSEGPRPVAGHCIRDAERNILGYAAVTGDQVWSLYDAEMEQVGVLSRAGNNYTVFWLGGDAGASSMLSVEAETFPAALAIAYEVDTLPGLSPAVITPTTRTTEVPRARVTEVPGSRVLFRKQVVGFVCESAMDHAWAVFNPAYEQTALIARDRGEPVRYRVCWLGASAEDSMDFSVHESLLGAVAASFHLPSAPLLDPPLED